MKNNQGFSNILLIVVFLVLFGVAGFFGYNYYLTSNSLPNDMPKLPESDQLTNGDLSKEETSKIVESVKKEIEDKNLSRIKSITSENGTVWWITEDGYSTLTENDPSFMVKFDKRSSGSPSPKTADFDEINLIVKNKLLNQGFKLNELNSNTGLERAGNKGYIDFIQAFEKPGIKCVGKGSPDMPYFETSDSIVTEYNFSCTTDEKIIQNYNALKPFTDIYVNAQEADRKTFVLYNLDIEDEKALASFRDRIGGSRVSFYKEGDTWKFLHPGQAVPDCADLIKRGVPKKFQDPCIDYKNPIE